MIYIKMIESIFKEAGVKDKVVDFHIANMKKFEPLLIKPTPILRNKEIKRIICFFDIIIVSYILTYEYISEEFLKGHVVVGNKKYNSAYNIAFVILMRVITHDLITMRNLVCSGFDAQFHSISRNFIEKSKIFCLCSCDEEFFKNFTQYIDISDESLYKEFTKNSKMDKRLSDIAKKHRLQQKNTLSLAVLLDNKTIRDRIDYLGNPFVHSNNFKQMMKYFLENTNKGKAVNLSILHGTVPLAGNQYKFMCELAYLIFNELPFLIRYNKNNVQEEVHWAMLEVYGVYIKYFYPK